MYIINLCIAVVGHRSIAFSQEHFKTISYAKFGGQTECIMGDSKIVNNSNLPLTRCNFCFPSGHFYIILPSITLTMF